MSESSRVAIPVGARVRLGRVGNRRQWWRVRAADDRYAVLTHQADFRPKGRLKYCVIDQDRQVRGPINLVGHGYGDGTFSDQECAALLAEMQSGALEVTWRNPAPLEILALTTTPQED